MAHLKFLFPLNSDNLAHSPQAGFSLLESYLALCKTEEGTEQIGFPKCRQAENMTI